MFTIVTTPRPLAHEPNRIAFLNAVRSWTRLSPRPEILVFDTTDTVAHRLEVREDYRVITSHRAHAGRPYFDSFIETATRIASHDILMYCTDHLILTSDIIPAIQTTISTFPGRFLLVGQRWRLNVHKHLDFTDPTWESNLRSRVLSTNSPGSIAAKDFIVWRRPLNFPIPDFIMGYPWYDTYLVTVAQRRGIPVIDASRTMMTVHQSHEIPGGSAAARELTSGGRHNHHIGLSYDLDGQGSTAATPYVLTANGIVERSCLPFTDPYTELRAVYLSERSR